MLITLLGPVMESVNCQVLLLLALPTVTPSTASFLPSLGCRLYWALAISRGLHCPPTTLCLVVQTECGRGNNSGLWHWRNEYLRILQFSCSSTPINTDHPQNLYQEFLRILKSLSTQSVYWVFPMLQTSMPLLKVSLSFLPYCFTF